MDRLEMLVRDDCASAADAHSFSPTEMLAGVRERRRVHRRRVMVGVSTVIVVSLAAVTVGAAATLRPTRVAPAAPSPGASTTGGSLGAFWPGTVRGTGPAVLDATFTDSQHGYLTVVRCHEVLSSCTLELAATTDAGDGWSRRSLPTRPQYLGELRPNHEIIAGGSQVLVYTCTRFTNPCGKSGEPELELYTSSDAGFNWRRLRPADVSHVDALPNDAVVGLSTEFGQYRSVLLVGARPDGSVTAVRGPALQGLQPRVLTADDGSLFVYGSFSRQTLGSAEVTAPELFVSRDRGLSWQRLATPVEITKEASLYYGPQVWPDQLLTHDARLLIYVSRIVDIDKFGGSTLTTSVYRSHDGGLSWHEVTVPNQPPLYDSTLMSQLLKGYAGENPPSNLASAALLPDNSLLVSQGGHLYRLDVGEQTFTEVVGSFGRTYLIQAGAMVLGIDTLIDRDVLGISIRYTDTFSLTTDGVTWRPVNLPD